MDSRSRGNGGRSGRIILLGDGTEVLTDGDEEEMLDDDGEKGSGNAKSSAEDSEKRGAREETPGPEPQPSSENSGHHEGISASTDVQMTDAQGTDGTHNDKPIPASALPDKLVTPLSSGTKK